MSDTSKKRTIELGPVQFRYADRQPHTAGTDDFRLFPHQAEFFENLSESLDQGAERFLFMESMTGSGKTTANILPAVERGANILITYPTNQLIQDQQTSIEQDASEFSFDLETEIINSRALRQKRNRQDDTIANILDTKFTDALNETQARIFLTTPDTLYNILTGKYWGSNSFSQPMDLAQSSLLASVDYIVFDEFHMYDISMETSILNMCCILHHNVGRQLPIVFSSATTDDEFKERLSSASINDIVEIDDERSITEDGVTICSEIELEIILGRQWNGPEVFKRTRREAILEAVSTGKKLTAIFESVKRTSNILDDIREDIPEVEGNWAYSTGLDSNMPIDQAPLVIGTRTLSVGIDFDTQDLFFESYRARDFMQKLGRVGRRASRQTSKATCYTSEYAVPELDQLEDQYSNKKELKRELIGSSGSDEGKMAEQGRMWGYPSDYGPIELDNMVRDYPIDIDEESLVSLSHEVYGKSPFQDESREWLDNFLMAFRDPGVPQVAIGRSDPYRIQLQEVMVFLEQRTTELQPHEQALIQKEELLEAYAETAPVVTEYIESGTIDPLLCYETPPSKDTSGSIKFRVNKGISNRGLMQYPEDTEFTLRITGGQLHGKLTQEIANRMAERKLLIYLVEQERYEKLPLPHLFKTYELEAAAGEQYQIAFGQNALKLDSHDKRCND
jgi:CRISPR-associated endonuclease/helicase Cas3